MNKLNTIIAVGAGVAAVSLVSVFAFAQHGPGHGGMGMGMGHGTMGQMMGQAGDPTTRLATLKTEIVIKPEQTAAWDSYAKVVTDTAADMKAHREHIDHDAIRKMETKDREAFIASMQKLREEAQGKVKAAADALLAKLDDSQKEKARQSLPGLVAGGPGMGMRTGMRGGGMGSGMGGHGMGGHGMDHGPGGHDTK